MAAFLNRGGVQSQSKGLEHRPHLTQLPGQGVQRSLGQPPDGADAQPPQLLAGGWPYIEQILHRQGVDHLPVVVPFNTGDGVRLFIVAAQLGGDFVVCHPDAAGDAKLELHPVTDFSGNGHGGAEHPYAAGDVQPVFIQAEGLDLVGIVLINFPCHLAEADIFPHIRGQHDQMGTALSGLPDCHTGLDAIWLGNIVGGQHNAVPLLLAAAYRQRLVPQLRVALHLHRGVKTVLIHVQNVSPISITSCL